MAEKVEIFQMVDYAFLIVEVVITENAVRMEEN